MIVKKLRPRVIAGALRKQVDLIFSHARKNNPTVKMTEPARATEIKPSPRGLTSLTLLTDFKPDIL